MPPRGHHEQQLPASRTNAQGKRGKAPHYKPDRNGNRGGGAPGSAGFGLTPQNVNDFYNKKNPDGSYVNDPNNNFRPTWEGGAKQASFAAAKAKADAAAAQHQAQIDQLIAEGRAKTQANARIAMQLIAAANGAKDTASQRVLESYGLKQIGADASAESLAIAKEIGTQ